MWIYEMIIITMCEKNLSALFYLLWLFGLISNDHHQNNLLYDRCLVSHHNAYLLLYVMYCIYINNLCVYLYVQ